MMISVNRFLYFTLLFYKCLATNLIVHETRSLSHFTAKGFSLTKPADDSTALNLRIALKQGDASGLEKAVYDVSTPGNANYGKHYTKDAVLKFVTPSEDTTTAVKTWLSSNGVTNIRSLSPAGDWIGLSLTVAKANTLLGANFSVFTDHGTGEELVRTLSYSIPASLKGHIKLIHPTVAVPSPITNMSIASVNRRSSDLEARAFNYPPCDQAIQPSCLSERYGIPMTLATQKGNGIAVPGFQGNYPSRLHLHNFLTNLRNDTTLTADWTDRFIDGATLPDSSSQGWNEADLDVEYTVGVASGVPVTFILAGYQNATIADFPNLLLDTFGMLMNDSDEDLIRVVSTSYGADEDNYTLEIVESVCNLFMQLAARGVSLLFASGDGGVQGSQFVEDNSETCPAFRPTFPSGCPFVTSIGGTSTAPPERAALLSSGGFSNFFSVPAYQAAYIPPYLSQINTTYSGMYNSTGRGFPDISAVSNNYIYFNHQFGYQFISGTSASTPVLASIIALINDRLLAVGKSPLGFLNPFLYSESGRKAFNDITTGSNPGCNTTGFPALQGWDPVTGLGTPNFTSLLDAALAAAAN